MTKNTEADVKLGKIRLTQPHNDRGIDYQPGDVLELREDKVQWLIDQGRGEKVAKREQAANTQDADPSTVRPFDPSTGSGLTAQGSGQADSGQADGGE